MDCRARTLQKERRGEREGQRETGREKEMEAQGSLGSRRNGGLSLT